MSEPTRLKAIAAGVFIGTPIAGLSLILPMGWIMLVHARPEWFQDYPIINDATLIGGPIATILLPLIGAVASAKLTKSGKAFPLTHILVTAVAFAATFLLMQQNISRDLIFQS